MSLLRVGDISIHLTTTRFDLTFPYIPYSFSTWFSSPMTCRAYERCISHASLDLLRSLNQDQSPGGFSSAMVDPDNKNKRTKTALLIMRISLMLITRLSKNHIPSHSQRLIPVIFIAAFNWPIPVISMFFHPLRPFGAFGAGIAGFQQVLVRHFRSQHYAAIRP